MVSFLTIRKEPLPCWATISVAVATFIGVPLHGEAEDDAGEKAGEEKQRSEQFEIRWHFLLPYSWGDNTIKWSACQLLAFLPEAVAFVAEFDGFAVSQVDEMLAVFAVVALLDALLFVFAGLLGFHFLLLCGRVLRAGFLAGLIRKSERPSMIPSAIR